MPAMNGYDFCVELKNNVDTKYIPVILLTARSSVDEQARGYQAGADSYITKPVNLRLLESRIAALLLKKHQYVPFQKVQFIPQPKFPKLSAAELLARVEDIVRDNISDPEFTVKDLTEQLGMSNSMLYRKIKQITNFAPVDLVRRIRLNSAASLLKKGRMNISEVAYETGFSDQSYFALCFKKKFGVSPTQYIRNQSAEKGTTAL
jgi:AraC-like DNA-binding protein